MVTRITSRQNRLILSTAALHEKKYRDRARSFLIEGKKLAREAFASGAEIVRVFVTEDSLPFALSLYGAKDEHEAPSELICLPESVFEKISSEKAPQGIICVLSYLDKIEFLDTINSERGEGLSAERVFALCSIRDPGNLGTIIRTFAAFGGQTLLMSSDCADVYNPRTLRAAMGTIFRVKIVIVADLPRAIGALCDHGKRVYAAMLDEGAAALPDLAIDESLVFVVGNEGHGIDEKTAAVCTGAVMIPMAKGSAESLNAAMAATVLLWESFRGNGD